MPFIARIPTLFLLSIVIGTGTFLFIRRLSKVKRTVIVRRRINLVHGWMRMSLLITLIVQLTGLRTTMMGRLISVTVAVAVAVIQFNRRNVTNRTFGIMVYSQRRKVNLSGRLVPVVVVPASSSWLFQRRERRAVLLSLLLWRRLINVVTKVITSFTESVKRISKQGKRCHFMFVTCLRLDWTSLRPLCVLWK
jgi:hypothetical protein